MRAVRRLVTIRASCRRGLGTVASFSSHVTRLATRGRALCSGIVGRTTILAGLHSRSNGRVRERVRDLLIPLNVPGIHFIIRLGPHGRPSDGKVSDIAFLFSTGGGKALRGMTSMTSNNRVTHIVLSLGTVVTKTIGLPAVVFSRVSAKISNSVTRGVTLVVRRVKGRGHRIVDVARLPRVTTHNVARCGMCGRSARANAGDRVHHLASRREMGRVTGVLDKTALARTTLGGTGTLVDN